jgi:hypothetical protein
MSVIPRPHFTPAEGYAVPIVQEAGWASEPVWIQRLEEKSLCLCRKSNPDRPSSSPVSDNILTELFRIFSKFHIDKFTKKCRVV